MAFLQWRWEMVRLAFILVLVLAATARAAGPADNPYDGPTGTAAIRRDKDVFESIMSEMAEAVLLIDARRSVRGV